MKSFPVFYLSLEIQKNFTFPRLDVSTSLNILNQFTLNTFKNVKSFWAKTWKMKHGFLSLQAVFYHDHVNPIPEPRLLPELES